MFDALSEYERIKDPQHATKLDESRARACFRLSMGTVLALFVAYLVFNYIVINGERLAEEQGLAPLEGSSADVGSSSIDFPDAAQASGDASAVDVSGTDGDLDDEDSADIADTDASQGASKKGTASKAAKSASGSDAVAKALSHAKGEVNEEAAGEEDADNGEETTVGDAAEEEDAADDGESEKSGKEDDETDHEEAATADEDADEAGDEAASEDAESGEDVKGDDKKEGVLPGDNSLLGETEMHGAQWWLGAGFGFLGLATLVLLCANTAPTATPVKGLLSQQRHDSYTVLV